MRIRDNIKHPRRPVVFYEILPPREKDATLDSYAGIISSLLSQTHIDAINIPEVREEERDGLKPIKSLTRAEPREFGKLLQDIVGIETVVNRVVVHQSIDQELRWIEETNKNYEIENLIVVGGESHKVDYPGPSVNKALRIITGENDSLGNNILCGGISIPSRKEESKNLIKKSENGAEFFTTQVLYNSDKITKMISHYQNRCQELNTFPRRILLSFAPVSSQKNIEFLKWLGVEIPSETEKYLNGRPGMMIDRSLDVAIEILNDTLEHIINNKLIVPIGLNVEHIMTYNFQSSVEMLQELARIYREFCIKADFYT